jgi:hypothetical protein
MKIFIAITISIILFGCNQPDPNPEATDPVVAAIKREIESVNKQLVRAQVAVRRNTKALGKMHPHEPEYAPMKLEIENKKNDVRKLTQDVRFFEVKLEKRVQEVRKKALEAFKRGAKLDHASDLESFFRSVENKNMPKDWSERVPVMYDPTVELKDEMKKTRNAEKNSRRAAGSPGK